MRYAHHKAIIIIVQIANSSKISWDLWEDNPQPFSITLPHLNNQLFPEVPFQAVPEWAWRDGPGAHQADKEPCTEMVNNSLAVLR